MIGQTAGLGREVCWVVKTDGIGREVCWSVKTAGYVGSRFGRYVGQSNDYGSGVGKEVCWLVKVKR